MLGGAGIGAVWGHVVYLLGFALLCFLAAIRLFRWT